MKFTNSSTNGIRKLYAKRALLNVNRKAMLSKNLKKNLKRNWLPFYRPYSFASQSFDCFADIQFWILLPWNFCFH